MPIECQTCGAKSEKMPIMVYAGHSKCWNCLAMAGLSGLRNSILRTVSRDDMDRIMTETTDGLKRRGMDSPGPPEEK